MQSQPVVHIPFSFAHAVWHPHFHSDASVRCVLRGPIDVEPTSRTFLMGPDLVWFRDELQAVIGELLVGRVLYHDGAGSDGGVASEVHDAATRLPVEDALVWTRWDLRPTVEVISLVVAERAVEIAGECGFEVIGVEFWESVRSGVVLDAEDVATAGRVLHEMRALMLAGSQAS